MAEIKYIKIGIGIIFASVVFVGILSVLFSRMMNAPVPMERVLGEARNVKGAQQPTVTVVEFSDFQCPACKSIQPVLAETMKSYTDQPVQFVFRHFPLTSIHPLATRAATASEVAAEMGKFWEYHDILYEKQDEWVQKTGDELDALLISYAEGVGLNRTEFETKLKNPTPYQEKVQKDALDADALRLQGTPTFFVNGKQTQLPNLSEAIEKNLHP